jgi:type VI secretion system protein ImpA
LTTPEESALIATIALLDPVAGPRPCGEDMAFSPELDAIAKARLADDPTLDQGAWVTSLKEADWPFVLSRCATLLASRSKDLRLAVWLAEAGTKTGRLRGLADGLALVAGLCDRYWDQLYPLPDEGGHEQRIGNLCWLAARIPPLLHEIPICEGAGYSMRDVEIIRQRNDGEATAALDNARRTTSLDFYRHFIADSTDCLQGLADLERVVDDRLGADGPGFTAARSALQSLIHAISPAAMEAGLQADASMDEAKEGEVAVVSAAVPVVEVIQDRKQALAQLRLVAQYFRHTEPHSPVAYLAEKAAHWGEQPLHVWLRAVVKDPAALAQFDELLGVHES